MNSMQTIHARVGRREMRRDGRYTTPPLELEIEGRSLTSINWSLGGFLVRGDWILDIGATVTGRLRVAGSDGFFFIARVVRREPLRLAFQFEELTPLALGRLDLAGRPR